MKKVIVFCFFLMCGLVVSFAQETETTAKKRGLFHRKSQQNNKPRAQKSHFEKAGEDNTIKHNGTRFSNKQREKKMRRTDRKLMNMKRADDKNKRTRARKGKSSGKGGKDKKEGGN